MKPESIIASFFTMSWPLFSVIQVATIFLSASASAETNKGDIDSIFRSFGYSPACVAGALTSCELSSEKTFSFNIVDLQQEIKSLSEEVTSIRENVSKHGGASCESALSKAGNVSGLLEGFGYSTVCVSSALTSCEISTEKESPLAQVIKPLSEEIKTLREEITSINENDRENRDALWDKLASVTNSLSEMKTILQEVTMEKDKESKHNEALREQLVIVTNSLQEVKEEQDKERINWEVLKEQLVKLTESQSVIQTFIQEVKPEVVNITQSLSKESTITVDDSAKPNQETTTQETTTTTTASTIPQPHIGPKKNCADLRVMGDMVSGVRTVRPDSSEVVVYCDQDTDGGGWTVIQSRVPLPVRENFTRSWSEYEAGFGDPSGEYWLGLQHIHALTSSVKMELRIDLESDKGRIGYAKYSTFHVGDAASKYTLSIGGYSGTAGDAMTDTSDKDYILNGMKFSTYDQDNDLAPANCAKDFGGGWWFNSCSYAHLNRPSTNIYWWPFPKTFTMEKTSMKIRPV